MELSLLDTAFLYVVGRDARISPLNAHIDPDKARRCELERLFPAETVEAVEHAYRRAQHLLAVACELAELNRGPNNDGTGPCFDAGTLAERCPGFSGRTYAAALNEGFMLTR
jgi:hypothetical protein